MDDQLSSTDTLMQKALSWDLDQWSHECALLSPERLSLLIPYANPESDPQTWKEKLHQLYFYLPNFPVESFGRALNSLQFLEIMRFAGSHEKDHHNRKKLSSLFVGVSPGVFKDLLSQASPIELSFLREEAVTEPVQHHLSLITSELSRHFNDLCNQIEAKEREIEAIDLQTIGNKELEDFYKQFENFNKEEKNILTLTSSTLAIAWNAHRADLIQELGRIKELGQKCLIESIGTMETREHPSSGLYKLMDKKVEQVFSDQDSEGNQAVMKDSTPALEALVKFSVWYIQDYVEVGLLPDKHSIFDTEENLKNREQLFMMAEENLGKMGLKTLLDLKNARIYSKRALKEYISSFGLRS